MATNLHFVWNRVDHAFLNREYPPELAWILCWEKEEESLKSCSLIPILDHMEGENRQAFENTKNAYQALKQSFMYNFFRVD